MVREALFGKGFFSPPFWKEGLLLATSVLKGKAIDQKNL
jgi:hypothetical protein